MTPLAAELREIIAAEGPISVERYMTLCLQHPRYGYYITHDAIGRRGDFVTAPEIHQMFGELIGLWAAQLWISMGAPHVVRFVELGPGRGTLMADALRAARIVPGFLEAASVELVETSPRLEATQRAALDGATRHLAWHRTIEGIPRGPRIIIANEFFDALPVRHYIRGMKGWHERVVGLGADTTLEMGAAAEPIPIAATSGTPGQILEVGHAAIAATTLLAQQIAEEGGAMLICDYGHAETSLGETLQAVRGHAYADILDAPGEADLTAHVDFAALRQAAQNAGAAAYGPLPQGQFLLGLGLAERAQTLKARADERQAAEIDTAMTRWTAAGSTMATVFKAMAIVGVDAPPPPGFEETR